MSQPAKKQKVSSSAHSNGFIHRNCKDIYDSLRRMYQNEDKFSDITVLVGTLTEGVHFKCSSTMLAASSPVLAAMMFGELADAWVISKPREDRILQLRHLPELNQPSAKYFRLMLDFIHGLSIKLDIDTATDLYIFADYLGILCMRNECSQFLWNVVCVNNVCTVLERARRIECKVHELLSAPPPAKLLTRARALFTDCRKAMYCHAHARIFSSGSV